MTQSYSWSFSLYNMKKRSLLFIPALFAVIFACAQKAKMPAPALPVFKKDSFYITTYGAKPDGITLNTESISKAITACNKKGGGVVVVPAGLFLTGPIELKSNVNLHLQKNALLQMTTDHEQFKLVAGNWEGLGQMRNQSPISATNATNIAISGYGIIDGAGDSWRMVKKDKLTETNWKKLVSSGGLLSEDKKTWYPSVSSQKGSTYKNPGEISADKTPEFYASVKDFLRPNLLVFTSCKKILLEGVTFQNSPAWCLHPLMSSDITIRNINAKNPWYAQNGDGIDLESCNNVVIENSTFDVGDDGICIKSGRDEAGRKRGMPTENVLIQNCTVYHAHGGFVVGSEMSGGARNIWVNNCTFIGTDIGLRFKTTRGRGGIVENIYINKIAMKDIVAEAILFDMYYMAQDPVVLEGEKREPPKVEVQPVTEATPQFRNIYVNDVVTNGADKAIFVRGLPEMNVKNLVLENMVLQAKKGLDITEGEDITLRNVRFILKETDPVLNIHNSKRITLNNIGYNDNAELLLNVSGEKETGISLLNTDTSKAKKGTEYNFGAVNPVTFNVSKPNTGEGAHSYGRDLALTAMHLWKDSFTLEGDKAIKWRYDQGVILKGIEKLWNATGEKQWFDYIQKSMDVYVTDEGDIRGYKAADYTLDNINNGKLLLFLYRVTGKEKYRKAADLLREQLKTQPRTSQGGFWHKKIYPSQMWLDGLYMAAPFYAEYAMLFHEDSAFNDIAKQFILAERNTRDPKTGLLYHGWDESREQQWADKKTGRSPNVWGRAMGWYGMAMVDALDFFPAGNKGRDSIIAILNRFAKAVTAVQDPKTGLWYDIVDKKNEPKNYPEASASSMFVYTLAKAVRIGYIPSSYLVVAKKGYDGIIKKFIKEENGQTNLYGTVSVSGLGGKPYRDGSLDYYMSERVIVNDPKGMGAFINAAAVMEMWPGVEKGNGKKIILDNYFNNEWKKDVTGTMVPFHYVWADKANSGFSMLGSIFHMNGVKTATLTTAPTAQNLRGADIYLIVDPDTEKETTKPNYISEADVKSISNWVKAGGVLVLMGNDAGNAEFEHFNKLAKGFGIKFNVDNYNLVKNDLFEQGVVEVPAENSIFKTGKKLYVKELSTLEVSRPAKAIITKEGHNIVAVSKFGKGTVFAIGDPWLYNEYVDGRKLPADFENYKAATDLVKWLIAQVPAKKAK
jgi:unsaturated rhamnogalacturonyl hydrolase